LNGIKNTFSLIISLLENQNTNRKELINFFNQILSEVEENNKNIKDLKECINII